MDYEEIRRYIEQMHISRTNRMNDIIDRVHKTLQGWEEETEKSSGLQGSTATARCCDEIEEWNGEMEKSLARETEKPDLKPCPFCGGEAEMRKVCETDDHFVIKRMECYCVRCGATAQGYWLNGIFAYGNEKTCIEAAKRAWNKRYYFV